MDEILNVLTNKGAGTADGFNVNLAFLDVPRELRVFHTIEVTPKVDEDRSEVYCVDFDVGNNSLHTNRSVNLENLTENSLYRFFLITEFNGAVY